MKKYLYYVLCLFLVVSCTDNEIVTSQDIMEGEKAEFTFSVSVPELQQLATRSISEPTVTGLYLMVFDGRGMLTEVAKATPVGKDFGATVNEVYSFKVTLTQTGEKRFIHFIANYLTDEMVNGFSSGLESVLIPAMSVSDGKDAYWQRLEFDGICGDPSNEAYNATITKMTKVPLVRNYAKISINAERTWTNFELVGFVVCNTLSSGSVAPYNRNNGQFVDYIDTDYQNIAGVQKYMANQPEDASVNSSIPSKEDFDKADKYVYEHHHHNEGVLEVPEGKQTFVLVAGKYRSSSSVSFDNIPVTYYKADLVYMRDTDIGGGTLLKMPYYYNILRNFEYVIDIESISSEGYDTPQEAANKIAGNNLLASTEARPYKNVSDNHARMFVEYTNRTVVGFQPFVLKYKYFASYGPLQKTLDNPAVGVFVEQQTNGTEPAISGYVIDHKQYSMADTDVWGEVTITPNYNPNEIRKQTLMLYVSDYDNNLILSRDIDITVRPPWQMTVNCRPQTVEAKVGAIVNVGIEIPVGIDPLLFPLDFVIESEKSSIYPNHNAENNAGYMPVDVGLSLSPSGHTTVRYVKTLTLEDYNALVGTQETGTVTLNCPFLTNIAASATTVYVYNQYFNLGTDTFSN